MSSIVEPKIVSFLADAAISKGHAVKIGTNDKHVAKGAANTDKCIGLAQSAPTAAEETVEVAMPGGGGKGLLGENVSAGDYLVSHTDATLVKPNAAGDHVCGIAMEDGSSGEIISVLVVAFEAFNAE